MKQHFLFAYICLSSTLVMAAPISNVLGTGVTTGNAALVAANLPQSTPVTLDGRFTVTGPLSNLSAYTNKQAPYYTETTPGPNRWITAGAPIIGPGFGGIALATNTGIYDFSYQFDLTGFNPASATITGAWATDNCGEIWLNGFTGNSVGGGNTNCANSSSAFTALTLFTINSSNTTFNAGINTLEFRVYNSSGPMALLVTNVESNATATPEPATNALAGIALTAIGLLRYKRKTKNHPLVTTHSASAKPQMAILALLFGVCAAPSAHAGLVSSLPGLQSITFFEATGPITANTFLVGSAQLLSKLSDAGLASTPDFVGLGSEKYDVFYSNANGTPNVNGDCVTIEAIFPTTTGGGGLNIAQVRFNLASTSVDANAVCSAVYNGPNSIPGSAAFAVDGNPATASTMGSTPGFPSDPTRLRLTVTVTPEPSTFLLVGLSALIVGVSKRVRQHLVQGN